MLVRRLDDDLASRHGDTPFGNRGESCRIDVALGFKDTSSQILGLIVGQNIDNALGNDWPVVVMIVDEMYRTATDLRSMLDHSRMDTDTVEACSAESWDE